MVARVIGRAKRHFVKLSGFLIEEMSNGVQASLKERCLTGVDVPQNVGPQGKVEGVLWDNIRSKR